MKDKIYLRHIQDAIITIEEYMGGVDYENFYQNKMMVDAVVR